MKEKVIFLLLIIMILASCAGNRKYDDLMQRADSKMDVDDDSAMVAIRMLANYVLGCVYRDMHEVPLALEFYNKAAEQADTTFADCDYGTLYRVYSQMGCLFSKQYLKELDLDASFSELDKILIRQALSVAVSSFEYWSNYDKNN